MIFIGHFLTRYTSVDLFLLLHWAIDFSINSKKDLLRQKHLLLLPYAVAGNCF